MNKPRLPLHLVIDDCEVRILSAATRSREDLREAVTYAHGMVHGYFMAGAIDSPEFAVAGDRIRDIAAMAERQFDSLPHAA